MNDGQDWHAAYLALQELSEKKLAECRKLVPEHPHDGNAYDGCKCVCCTNVRVLQAFGVLDASVDAS